MKKYIITLITCAFSIVWFSSCKKALTEKLYSALSPTNFYKTPADAESALNGVFAVFPQQNYYMRAVYIISDLSCDIFLPYYPIGDRVQIFRGEVKPQNGQTTAFWRNSYSLIKNANDVITYVPGIDMDVVQRNNIVGNAYFLRAMTHFDLVRIYGDVPLVVGKSGENELFPARTASNLVYNQIIEDLKFAEANCLHADQIPESRIGRVSSEAASALLARVYLQRGSTGFAVATDNQSALEACNKVINFSLAHPGVISLSPVYKDIFDPEKKNGPESIFAIQFGAEPATTTNLPLMFTPAAQNGYDSFVGLAQFINVFAPQDVRGDMVRGPIIDGQVWISKYRDPGVPPGSEGRNNWIVIRYADVLLMQSEALNNINASDATKFNSINLVRTRAGLGSQLLNLSNTPGSADFINALSDERLRELAIEGVRRYDLLRFKKYKAAKAVQGITVDDNDFIMPIPQAEMDVNPNLVQNPGY